uniref:Uncharacterized protein n=1 Tax=Solanum lycopersicum TaxID=4081 RepID=A0A3Q7HD27_SOLLC
MPIFLMDVFQDLVYAYGWPSRLVRPIWKVKQAPKQAYPSFRRYSCAIANHYLGDSDYDVKNAKFFRGRPSRPCLCIRLSITACPTHLEANHFLGDPDSDVKNANFLCGRLSRPCLFIRLSITLVRPIWKVKRALKRAYPSFRRFSCLIANHFLDDPDSDVKNANVFCGHPSIPCLRIRLSLIAIPTYFQGQPSPEARIPPFRRFSCTVANLFLGLGYADGCPSRPFLCNFKVKRAPKRLSLKASTTQFQGQTSPEARIPSI